MLMARSARLQERIRKLEDQMSGASCHVAGDNPVLRQIARLEERLLLHA